jgi:competence protein ComEC
VARAILPLIWLAQARGQLFPWLPVCMALGIGAWFAALRDPSTALRVAVLVVLVLSVLAMMVGPRTEARLGPLPGLLRPVFAAIAAVALGWLAADLRALRVDAPILPFRYYGPVEGRIVDIDRSQSDALRLTLDRVRLDDVAPARTPARVRLALHGIAGDFLTPEAGMRVMTTAHLSPPDGPVEPGGFDFQRMAWFRGLGAWGYTRVPVLAIASPDPGEALVTRLRLRISAAVQQAVPGEPGAFAAAILTGDRSGIGQETLQDLRDSNLAHLLAISGLHMGLLVAFVFAGLRHGLALVPALALRVNTKKVAAVVALAAGAGYLALSGGNVATERAFTMVAVMLGAVLLDRRALSLRTVALAAILILAMQPEALLEPGFQMSFAATIALVAGFAALRDRAAMRRLPGWAQPIVTLFVSSSLAGLATAPVAAAHFNRIAEYGLAANLVSVPLMGLAVIPAAVVAGLVAPLGLSALPLWVMEQATRWILGVAAFVADLPGAVATVASPGPWVLPLMALGGLWVAIWSARVRHLGWLAVAAGLWLWPASPRPLVLIAADGGLVGWLGPEGRVLSAARGNGFAARIWLESDGDRADQLAAAARPGLDGDATIRRFKIAGFDAVHIKGRGAADRLTSACAEARIVILAAAARATPPGCAVVDLRVLTATGPVAIHADHGTLRLVPSLDRARKWTGQSTVGQGTQALLPVVAALQDDPLRQLAATGGMRGQ